MGDKIGFMDGRTGTVYTMGKRGILAPVIQETNGFAFACLTGDSGILALTRSKVLPTVKFLTCLDLQGRERWRYEEAGVRSIPKIADDGSIVFITDGSDLCVLWPDGRLRSKWLVGANDFDLRGKLVAAYDEFAKLIKIGDLDGNVVLKLSLPPPGIPSGIALDTQTNLFVSWANNLERYDARGERVWSHSFPMTFARRLNSFSGAGVSIAQPEIAADGRGHVYCHTGDGSLQAYDRSGKLLWSHLVGTSAWMDVGPAGHLIVVGEDVRLQTLSKFSSTPSSIRQVVAPTSGSVPFLVSQPLARRDRVFCFSAASGLIWEQSLPSRISWHLPRSRADMRTLWENVLGYHEQRHFLKPLVMRDGTVLVTESPFMATNAFVYAVRGNGPGN